MSEEQNYLTIGYIKSQIKDMPDDAVLWTTDKNGDCIGIPKYGGIKAYKFIPTWFLDLGFYFKKFCDIQKYKGS